jgi:hypothetical protein
MQPVGHLFSQGDKDLDSGTLPRSGLDMQQSIDQLAAFAQVDHPQAAAVIVCAVDGFHVKADTVILDFEQG